jgi:hypothetical protein
VNCGSAPIFSFSFWSFFIQEKEILQKRKNDEVWLNTLEGMPIYSGRGNECGNRKTQVKLQTVN